jgi:hypothetical protein
VINTDIMTFQFYEAALMSLTEEDPIRRMVRPNSMILGSAAITRAISQQRLSRRCQSTRRNTDILMWNSG